MDIFDKKGVRPGIMKKFFVYGFYFLFWISSVLCAAPTENISLTIQGEDPFYSGLGVQSSGGANGGAADSTSQLGSILNLSQNYFQIGDMNLSQGVMQQSEVDLKLTGRNGLDFTISRSYSSAKQSSKPGMNPVNQALWGPYAGNGWGFNVGMRVWVVTPGYDSSGRDYPVKVFVETCDGTEEYEAGLSKQPGNFNKTIFIDSNGWEVPVSEAWIPRAFREIRFQTTDGKTFVFSKRFFSEQYFKGQGQSAMLGYMITGYYLTRIQDSAGNMIQFSYQDLAVEESVDANKLGPVIGQGNMDYIAKNYNPSQGQARYIKTRLESATDTFGRVIKFGYADSTNLATQDKDQMFSSIAYTDINGNTQKIAYSYDINGCLTSVKIGDLPAKTYGYVYFKPRYYRIEKGHYEYSCFGLFKEFKPDYRVDTYSSTGDTNNRQDVPFTTGYLLNKITTPLGAVIGYSYEDCLVTSSNAYQHFLTQSGRNTDIESGGSNHVVIQKTVNDGQSVKTYNFLYPRNSQGYLIKAKYRPPKQNYNAYYFASVTVDNPSEMVDETYTFQNAMVTDHVQGIYDTKTYWDFDRLLKAKEISFKNNVIQVQTEYQYGSYYNQISATTKK